MANIDLKTARTNMVKNINPNSGQYSQQLNKYNVSNNPYKNNGVGSTNKLSNTVNTNGQNSGAYYGKNNIDLGNAQTLPQSNQFNQMTASQQQGMNYREKAVNPTELSATTVEPSIQSPADQLNNFNTSNYGYSYGGGGDIPQVQAQQINFDKNAFIDYTKTGLEEQANQAYNTQENAARNTKEQALTDALNAYQKSANQNRLTKAQARQNYLTSIANANANAYNSMQQTNEAASNRGLSNSGLMTALQQNVQNNLNSNLAQIDMQYNQQVEQLNSDLTTLVNQYGLSAEEANNIYNNTVETLEANRQSAYKEAFNSANKQGMEYQLQVDTQNAANDLAAQQANASNAAQLASARIQASATLSAAAMQLDFEKIQYADSKQYGANLDRYNYYLDKYSGKTDSLSKYREEAFNNAWAMLGQTDKFISVAQEIDRMSLRQIENSNYYNKGGYTK